MKNTIYALTLATAGLLGSCSPVPDEETVALCQGRAKVVMRLAKTYGIKSLENELSSSNEGYEWCSTDKTGVYRITKIALSHMLMHCDNLKETAYDLLGEDPFKKLIFQRQTFCSSSNNILELQQDIKSLRFFIDSYKNGASK